jgi:cellulose biosynthesis protein BcsQ
MKIISVISIHPGSGQTTVLVNLASGLVRQGKRVLIGELGPSPKLRDWLGVKPDSGLAINSAATLDNLQTSICSSRLGMDWLTLATSRPDYLPVDSILTALAQTGYDYLLLHPATAKECRSSIHIADTMLVCTDLRRENELQEIQILQENLQTAGGTSQGISLIVPNRIDTREWDHNSRQLMALADYFGFDKIADPIPT